ncbi:MAG: amidohydrolase family protein [Mycobacterium sp.]
MVAIDMHAHVSVPALEALLASSPDHVEQLRRDAESLGPQSMAYNVKQLSVLGPALNDADLRLAWMDHANIDVQAVSPVPLPHSWAGQTLASQIVATTNAAVAEHCARAPHRLKGIGTVSLQHAELAADQLRQAVNDHGLVGVQISTTAGPRELDHPSLNSFWECAVQLDVPVLIHPWGCTLGARLNLGYMFNTVGNPTETTIALSRIIFGGVLDRYPALRIWGAHGGGYLPSCAGRADHAWRTRSDARTCRELPSSYLRRMWFDSLVYDDHNLQHLATSIGPEQITLGSDYPFDMGVTDPVARVQPSGPSSDGITARCEDSAVA